MGTFEEAYKASLDYYGGDDLSAKTFVGKYALRDHDGVYEELTPDDMHRRLAREFARIEKKYKNPLDEETIYQALKDFKYLVPQGSPMSAIGNPYVIQSLSNCVVTESPEDNVQSIMDAARSLAQLFKRRCGVGIDISKLRPEGTVVNNAARTTTGAWSFADLYSYVCRMIGQAGRRGALMISIDVRHPDIFQFVKMKRDLSKVTGANVSIRINDEFMEAVRDNKDFELRWPCEGEAKITRTVKAMELWVEMIESVHGSAEPGLLMWDNITRELPAHYYKADGFETISTNPCGELPLSANDACRLLTINIASFVKNKFQEDASFDFKSFAHYTRMAQRLMDDIVDLEIECIDKILSLAQTQDEIALWTKLQDSCRLGRRTGTGTFALGDALACLRLPYDSDAGIEMAGKIFESFRNECYEESITLAEERGAFPIWKWETEKSCPFLQRLPEKTLKRMKKFGRRNISLLTNAPTGSVAIVSHNSSSGIEPVFRNFYTRRKKINHDDKQSRIDFVDHLGDKWQEFPVFHRNVADWIRAENPDWDGSTIPELPDFFTTSDKIDWQQRVKIQGVIQSYIDHSISCTINLPEDVPKHTVGELYLRSWEHGLKGVTIYREGSRTGVLVSSTKDKDGRPTKVSRTHAPRRPVALPCDIYHGVVQGDPWTIVVGLLEGEPYELFGGPSKEAGIPKSVKSGFMSKFKLSKDANRYDIAFTYNGEETKVSDIGNLFKNKTYGTFTRMLSLALRHGSPVQHLVEQLDKDESDDLHSLSSILRRALKKYVADDTIATVVAKKGCEKCGSSNVVYQDGCPVCRDCGFTKCN